MKKPRAEKLPKAGITQPPTPLVTDDITQPTPPLVMSDITQPPTPLGKAKAKADEALESLEESTQKGEGQ